MTRRIPTCPPFACLPPPMGLPAGVALCTPLVLLLLPSLGDSSLKARLLWFWACFVHVHSACSSTRLLNRQSERPGCRNPPRIETSEDRGYIVFATTPRAFTLPVEEPRTSYHTRYAHAQSTPQWSCSERCLRYGARHRAWQAKEGEIEGVPRSWYHADYPGLP